MFNKWLSELTTIGTPESALSATIKASFDSSSRSNLERIIFRARARAVRICALVNGMA